jgi:hypothetical protein
MVDLLTEDEIQARLKAAESKSVSPAWALVALGPWGVLYLIKTEQLAHHTGGLAAAFVVGIVGAFKLTRCDSALLQGLGYLLLIASAGSVTTTFFP